MLGAMLAFLPRFILFSGDLICLAFVCKVLSIGHRLDKPITGLRKKLIHYAISFACRLTLFTAAIRLKMVYLTPEQVNHYSEYLGTPEQQRKC